MTRISETEYDAGFNYGYGAGFEDGYAAGLRASENAVAKLSLSFCEDLTTPELLALARLRAGR